MKSARLAGLFVVALVVISANVSIGQERNQDGKLEVLRSDGFEVSYARLEDSKQPHLQYRIINISGTDLPKLRVEMVAYDAKNNIIGAQRWNLRVDLKTGASTHGILASDTQFAAAVRVTLKFTALNSDGETECDQKYCGASGECGTMASSLCATGIRNFACQQGAPCSCKVVCQATGTK